MNTPKEENPNKILFAAKYGCFVYDQGNYENSYIAFCSGALYPIDTQTNLPNRASEVDDVLSIASDTLRAAGLKTLVAVYVTGGVEFSHSFFLEIDSWRGLSIDSLMEAKAEIKQG